MRVIEALGSTGEQVHCRKHWVEFHCGELLEQATTWHESIGTIQAQFQLECLDFVRTVRLFTCLLGNRRRCSFSRASCGKELSLSPRSTVAS